MIRRSTQRLSQLVDQLLGLRQLEQQRYPLRIAQGDLAAFVEDTCRSFQYWAEQQAIDYQYRDETHDLAAGWFDADVLDKILSNLLSNAFKYTPKHGRVEVLVAPHPTLADWVVIRVSDTGVGMREDQLPKIFDRFYRIEQTAHQGGTGIGLSLCQELVALHQGEITVSSAPGRGSTFTVAIPTQAEAYPGRCSTAQPGVKKVPNDYDYPEPRTRPLVDQQVVEDALLLARRDDSADQRPLVLVADDNVDLLLFVRESISRDYRVVTAQNGQEAFQKAIMTVPDAVVSDVAMPLMDGFQLTRQLKEDMRTSHIPIILLTARASEQHQVEGLESGADDYMTKPFGAKVLIARLQSLINNRIKLRKLLVDADESNWHRQVHESPENAFLVKLTTLIDENKEDVSFGTDDLCQALGMSRSQLYRKVTAITGQSVHEFIKLYRLSKAAELLCQGRYTVTEVANLTGFKYLQSFTRSFKERYDCTPRQYTARHTQRT